MNVSEKDDDDSVQLPHLRISLHGDCNMRCIYCPPWGENSYTIDNNLDTPSLKEILKELSKAGFRVVKFTGGEPTLRKDIIDIVNFSKDLFPETRIITNGWSLSKIAPQLKQAGLNIIEVSLDAAEPESYARMTQTSQSMYVQVREGIEKALALEFPIQLNMVVTKQNFNQIEPMLRLVENFGNVTLKMLELVYYEYPGYQFWKDNFVSMDEVMPIVQHHSKGSTWVYPPGNVGSPMPGFVLENNAHVLVKDGVIGTTYANVCKDCPVFPCQDGLYGLTLTVDGYLKMCKHRPDLHEALFEVQEGKHVFSPEKTHEGVQKIRARYGSLRFLEQGKGGWTPKVVEQYKSVPLVQPTQKVLKWYRKKEYGGGYEEVVERQHAQVTSAIALGKGSSEDII